MDNDEDDYPPPEGVLIRVALERSGLSARQAASQLPISDSRLRHIMNGYQPAGRGQRISVRGPDDTLAQIGHLLGITPEEFETTGRTDVARAMRRRYPDGEDDDEARFLSLAQEIEEWAEDPLVILPPDGVLTLFDDSALLSEVGRRMRRGQDEQSEATTAEHQRHWRERLDLAASKDRLPIADARRRESENEHGE